MQTQPWTWTDITLLGTTIVEETAELELPADFNAEAAFHEAYDRAVGYGLVDEEAA